MDTNILYEDNDLLIIEKSAIIPSYIEGTEAEDLLNALKEHMKKSDADNDELYPEADEILGSPIGGAAVFAKNANTASFLTQNDKKNNVTRKYRAIVRGKMPKDEDTLTDYLIRIPENNSFSITGEDDKNAIKSALHYKVIDRNAEDDLTLMEIEMEKGYSYHIRVQLANVGNVLHGDTNHGQHYNKVGQPIALWSYSVNVQHPSKDSLAAVESTPPDEAPWDYFY
ncbi:pseudouridine synthase [Lacicoccus qingdaonensis]|uniref:RNA pseudouridylate synthase n=1 Tax=Lacicoccus qingdaonensis TaxID=576118 RepID=A0A1G9J0D5_9BACL|nr:pseudouridine synthase [Salinicoccus qingdaonensis]SDL30930.1 23S rRNA pseudouridine1911/1915/1917 synthase [Salinicoccus qingdaonensis]